MSLPYIVIEGNLTADPELRFTPSGTAVVTFTVAASQRKRQDDGTWVDDKTTFLKCTAWKQAAMNVAESLQRGDKVIVRGRLEQRSYETKEGDKRTVYEVNADEIGVSVNRNPVKVLRAARASSPAVDQWASDDPGF